jgi:hypothetical protein
VSRSPEYIAYLGSPEWQRKRRVALAQAEHRCQVCNGARELDVHHRTYERLGDERPTDLTVLCRRCHNLFHEGLKPKRPKRPKRPRICPRCGRRQTKRKVCGACKRHELDIRMGVAA